MTSELKFRRLPRVDTIKSDENLKSSHAEEVVQQFNQVYVNSPAWKSIYWQGVQTLKCPTDLWIYQEIIYDLQPDVIIETGTFLGGSALYLANVCDVVGHGRVISIDMVHRENRPEHPRIQYINGSSTSDMTLSVISSLIGSNEKALVILDSDHEKNHVLTELNLYKKFVSVGSYMIVEDMNLEKYCADMKLNGGPAAAVDSFLQENKNFHADRTQEKLMLTFNPKGTSTL